MCRMSFHLRVKPAWLLKLVLPPCGREFSHGVNEEGVKLECVGLEEGEYPFTKSCCTFGFELPLPDNLAGTRNSYCRTRKLHEYQREKTDLLTRRLY